MTSMPSSKQGTCHLCKHRFPRSDLLPCVTIRPGVSARIEAQASGWRETGRICQSDHTKSEGFESGSRGDAGELNMLVVAAPGGNALSRRGETLTAEEQHTNIEVVVRSLSAISWAGHSLVTYGNSLQVGLFALQGAAYKPDEGYPLDVLGVETELMIGYMIERELENARGQSKPVVTLLTQVIVDPQDPAFQRPSKFVGPVYQQAEAESRANAAGWTIARDGDRWRRVVSSPRPVEIPDWKVLKLLRNQGVIVVCSGGAGIPVVRRGDGTLFGIEAIIDKDAASALFARQLHADALLLLTDVEAVFQGYGQADAVALSSLTPQKARSLGAPSGSMGPKLAAAAGFAETGGFAGIGRLADALAILEARAGTKIARD